MQSKAISQELFLLLGKLLPMVAIELLIVKDKKLLFVKRPSNDPYWPNKWHIPGGYLWYREPIKHALQRVAKRELGTSLDSSRFLGFLEFESKKENPRNHTVSLVFLCTPTKAPKEGKLFLATKLPKNFIIMQQRIINLFLESLQK